MNQGPPDVDGAGASSDSTSAGVLSGGSAGFLFGEVHGPLVPILPRRP